MRGAHDKKDFRGPGKSNNGAAQDTVTRGFRSGPSHVRPEPLLLDVLVLLDLLAAQRIPKDAVRVSAAIRVSVVLRAEVNLGRRHVEVVVRSECEAIGPAKT